MPETPIFKFPTPDGAASNDVERDLQLLAQKIEQQLDLMYPIGIAYPYLFDGPAPTGFLHLKGGVALVARYPRLAAKLNNSYFVDGIGYFTLPDLRGVVPRGATLQEEAGEVIGADQL